MSLTHLVTRRAATVVPFSTAISSLNGPLFYFHTQAGNCPDCNNRKCLFQGAYDLGEIDIFGFGDHRRVRPELDGCGE